MAILITGTKNQTACHAPQIYGSLRKVDIDCVLDDSGEPRRLWCEFGSTKMMVQLLEFISLCTLFT
jgi:hypothetical protein